jgi:hypothetical protein
MDGSGSTSWRARTAEAAVPGAATNDNCDVLLAWHVTSGSKDGVDLSGLNAVMAVHSPKRMTDGGWKVALYLDDVPPRSSPKRWVRCFPGVLAATWPDWAR